MKILLPIIWKSPNLQKLEQVERDEKESGIFRYIQDVIIIYTNTRLIRTSWVWKYSDISIFERRFFRRASSFSRVVSRVPRNSFIVSSTSWCDLTFFRSVIGGPPGNFIASIRNPWLQVELCCSRNCMYRNLVTARCSCSCSVGAFGSTAIIFWYRSDLAVVFDTSDSRNVLVPILMSMTCGSLKPNSKSCSSMNVSPLYSTSR